MVPSLRAAFVVAALCGLAVYGFHTAANADSTSSQKSAHATNASGSGPSRPAENPPHNEPPPTPIAAPPDDSAEGIGSAALEHKLDQLEKNIQSAP